MAVPNLTANSPVAGSIAWSAFTIQYGGVAYGIPASSTSMKYVWWVYNNGAPILTAGNTLPDNLSADDLVLFVNKSGIPINVPSSSAVDGSLIVDGTVLAKALVAESISARELGADSVTTNALAAGSVTATELDVEVLRAGFTLTGRVQVGQQYWTPEEGLVIPQPNGGRIQLPADGVTPARFDGQANLDAATIRNNLNIMGATNKVSGQLALSAGITEPTIAPAMYQSWPTVTGAHVNSGTASWRVYVGMAPHHSDSTLAVAAVNFGSGGLAFFNKATGAWAGSMPSTATYMENYLPWGGVVFQNGHYFTYGHDSVRGGWYIYKIRPSDWAKVGEIQITTDPWFHQDASPVITASAGMVQLTYFVKGYPGLLRMQRWYADSLAYWNYNDFANFGSSQNLAAAAIHAADNGVDTLWLGLENERRFRAFPMDTLVETTSKSFGFAAGAAAHGIMWDTSISRFRSYDKSGNIHTYSSWATNQLFTASNTWYDGAGTVRETREGPAASYTLPARSHLSIETPIPPDSGNTDAAQVDKANRVKVYAATGANARRLQATLGVDGNGVSQRIVTLDAISTGTALTPASNTFVGGQTSPGKLVSAATDVKGPLTSLDGSGAARVAGVTMGDTGWVTLALSTGWSVWDGASSVWGQPAYRIINGVCHLRGLVTAANGAQAWTVLVLPAVARPNTPMMFSAVVAGGHMRMDIQASNGFLSYPSSSLWGTYNSIACSYPVG